MRDHMFACSLLRQGMKQIIISSDTLETKSLEKMENKSGSDVVNPKIILYIRMEHLTKSFDHKYVIFFPWSFGPLDV